MQNRIQKYCISLSDITSQVVMARVAMARGSIVRHVGSQNPKEITLWVETPAEDTVVMMMRTYVVVGTGGFSDTSWKYVGTAFNGSYVWHLYDTLKHRPLDSKET